MAERKIAGMEIRVDQPLATEALKLQARLGRLPLNAGGDIKNIILGLTRAEASTDERATALSSAITAIGQVFNTISPDEYAELVGDIVAMAKIKRPSGLHEPIDLDGDLSGNLGAIPDIVLFVIFEVLGDFFSAKGANGAPRRKAVA